MHNFKTLQFRPMMATPSEPFDHKDYIFEVKWDGYRALAYLDDKTRLQSRNLKDLSFHYPNLLDLHLKVKGTPVILDGEIITLENGRPSFQGLQGGKNKPAIFMAFDILYEQAQSVMNKHLLDRKTLLHKVIKEDSNFLISQYIHEKGIEFFNNCRANHLEGVVAKQIESSYLPGKRVSFWKKIKGVFEDDFVIIGYLPGKSSIIGSLALGGYTKQKLNFKGLVGIGLSEAFKQQLWEVLEELKTSAEPVYTNIAELQNCKFVIPHLVCTVEYLEKTKEGRLRHPVFKNLRHDKFAADIIKDRKV